MRRVVASVVIAIAGAASACGGASTGSVNRRAPTSAAGGYRLVIQFQNIAYFDGYAKTGRRVEGFGLDAVLSNNKVFVRDVERDTVNMFLAPEITAGSVDSLLRVVAHLYGRPTASLQVAA